MRTISSEPRTVSYNESNENFKNAESLKDFDHATRPFYAPYQSQMKREFTMNNDITPDHIIIQRQQKEIDEMQKQIRLLTLETKAARQNEYAHNQGPRITRTFDIRNQYPNPFAINVYPGARNAMARENFRTTPYPPRNNNYQNFRINNQYSGNRESYRTRFEQGDQIPTRIRYDPSIQSNSFQHAQNDLERPNGRIDRNGQYRKMLTCPYCKGQNPHNWSQCSTNLSYKKKEQLAKNIIGSNTQEQKN